MRYERNEVTFGSHSLHTQVSAYYGNSAPLYVSVTLEGTLGKYWRSSLLVLYGLTIDNVAYVIRLLWSENAWISRRLLVCLFVAVTNWSYLLVLDTVITWHDVLISLNVYSYPGKDWRLYWKVNSHVTSWYHASLPFLPLEEWFVWYWIHRYIIMKNSFLNWALVGSDVNLLWELWHILNCLIVILCYNVHCSLVVRHRSIQSYYL